MIPALKRLLVQQDPTLASSRVDLIKLHNGVGFRNPKVSFVVFVNDEPRAFLKSVRFPADNGIVDHAHEGLGRASAVASDIQPSARIPNASWVASNGAHRVCAETLLAGRPLDRSNADEKAKAFAWLDAFAVKNKGSEMNAADVRLVLETLLKDMKSVDLQFLAEVRQTFEKALVIAGGDALQLPHVPAHGDFTPANLLIDGGGSLGIIDWDRYGDITMPLFDLLTFLERTTLKGQDLFVTGKEAIMRQTSALGIDLRTVPLLTLFYSLMSDWRKRERMFPWEPEEYDRYTLAMVRSQFADAMDAFAP